jgi:branched-chain amino acid transport system ATP-binding protein
MLCTTDVVSGYRGSPVVRGVSLKLEDGGVIALLGRNGAGKSTLLRTLIGLIPVQSGKIYLDGEDVTHRPAHFRANAGIGYVPQGRQVFPALSVRENLIVGAKARTRKAVEPEIRTALQDFPVLREKIDDPGESLSGGQQQMLTIARALMSSPRILLLDEPCEGIQPSIISELLIVLERVSRERSLSILLVEQNLQFAADLTTRAYLMNRGEIVREVETASVAADEGLQRQYLGV